MSTRLTDQIARTATSGTKTQSIVWDSEIKGFGLRITARGAKAFVLDYRTTGRQRRITIGRYPDWSVVAARGEAPGRSRGRSHGRAP